MLRHFLLQLVLICGLAAVSGYEIPSLKDSNWETIQFLTPVGIVRNHLEAVSLLRPFYSETSEGQVALGPARGSLMALLYAAMALNAVIAGRRWRAGA